MSRAKFFVQFQRKQGLLTATGLTQTKPRLPRRGQGAVVVAFVADIPGWVFDPLDLVATYTVPAENVEPLIRLDSIGPVQEPTEVGTNE